MKSPDDKQPGIGRRRLLQSFAAQAAALALHAPAVARPNIPPAIQRLTAGDRDIAAFYAARSYRPLWIRGSSPGPEAALLLGLLRSADADGRDPQRFVQLGVEKAMESARGGTPEALAGAEVTLSRAFAAYVRDVRRPADIGIVYGERGLKPRPDSDLTILHRAAAARSLTDYLVRIGWMHPAYAGLRQALAGRLRGADPMAAAEERRIRLNLERARVLPAHQDRYILVDAAAARLTFYDAGEERESMRVVVGTSDDETPMMVGMIRYATLNPYWHVPPDITRVRIAPRVLKEGLGYFRDRGYEVVTEWSPSGRALDPARIDWKAIAAGSTEILVRQRPGPRNGMGNVKFQFPNDLGIYLHDTPAKQLFNADQRGFSAGCVRLEDAEGLGRLLFRGNPPTKSEEPEQTVVLSDPVPVYITYLTTVAENGRLARRPDIYGRDKMPVSAALARDKAALSLP